jgi:hypothetical protein
MSTETTTIFTFQAKDGLWYSTYQEKADANKKTNDEYLRSKGLLDTLASMKKKSRPRKRASPSRTTIARVVTPTPTRRSNRLRETKAAYVGLKLDFQEPARKKAKAPKNGTKARKEAFCEEDLRALQNVPDWLEEMEDFLMSVPHGHGNRVVGEANASSVMRQVQKLVSGVGITYHHWSEGTRFKRGVKTHLGMNFDKLYDEAVEMENKHGRDLGNGWLLRHPITKLKNFQQYKAEAKLTSSSTN